MGCLLSKRKIAERLVRDIERERVSKLGDSRGSREEVFSVRSTTIFVDNLPFHIRKIWLYNLFSRFGIIRDLFIPTKRSKITGQNFAFVRFSRVEDAETAISKTKDSWYWDRKLVVKFARFLRDVDVQDPQRSFNRNYTINSKSWKQNSQFSKGFPFNFKSSQWKPNAQSSPFKGKNLFHQSNLYVQKHQKFPKENRGKEVWRRRGIEETSKQGEQRNGKINETPATLHLGSIKVQSAGNGWLFRSAVAKMSRLISTEDLEHVFRREGDHKVQIKTLGGRFVIITFPDVASRDSIIKERWLAKWFEEIRPWKGEQANEERFVWLSCYGMPLNAWSTPTFKEIGDKWGKFLKIEDATLKEFSYAKAMILIATNQIHKIEGFVDLIIDKEIYTVRVMEEDSFRFIKQSFFDISSDLAMEKKSEEDDDKAMNMDEVDKPADVGSKNGPQEGSSNDEVANSNIETGVPFINNVAACIMESMSSSSLGIENSIVGSEKVADSFGDSSKENQSQSKSPNCLLDKESEMMMDSKMGAILDKEELNDKDGKVVVAIENEHDYYYANVNTVEEPNLDHFEANQIPIQAAIKGIKGKRNRKSINEILGYTKVNSGNIKGKRNKKCVVLRSAVASAALSASISSAEINNRNRILLDEAQAIWTVDKLFGISYDGDENEVISKIAEMEALNKVRANENH